MLTDPYTLKRAFCNQCPVEFSYKTRRPLYCPPCGIKRRNAQAVIRNSANREAIRATDRAKTRRIAAAEGRQLKTVRHEDQSEAAVKKRQAETCRRYREQNKEKRKESAREWARRNPKVCIDRQRERYQTDPVFNLSSRLRRRIQCALRQRYVGLTKSDRTINLLGCTFAQFKTHIERQFTRGMTWAKCFNGEIHLDHIRPCRSFDLSDPSQQRECFNYLNMRPLWAEENLSKHDRRTYLI